jgi:hypothetical protein
MAEEEIGESRPLSDLHESDARTKISNADEKYPFRKAGQVQKLTGRSGKPQLPLKVEHVDGFAGTVTGNSDQR